jgi:hypothetical protein
MPGPILALVALEAVPRLTETLLVRAAMAALAGFWS